VVRTVIFFVLLLGVGGSGSAQDLETPYLLDSFATGFIYYQSGDRSEAMLNFHKVTQEVVIEFNGQRVPLPDFSKMDSVEVSGHVFVFADGRPMEVLRRHSPQLFADYKYNSQLIPNGGAYGVKSHSTKVVTEKREGVGVYTWHLDDGYELTDRTVFWIVQNGEWNKFNNVRQLGQLFPEKRKALKRYADNQELDFANVSDIRELVSVAIGE